MSLSLLPSRAVLGLKITQPFSGIGGTGALVYSVLPGGAGGTINASTGLYTAPGRVGLDTVQVVDNLGKKATSPILIGTPLELLCDVIQTELGLDEGRVYVYNSKINMPTDQGLFVAVGFLSVKPFSNSRSQDSDGNSVQSSNFQAALSIEIISRGPEARDRKEEVVLALNSAYSEAQQELNSFRIFPIPTSFVNLSELDGSAIPYRFNFSLNLHYFVTKTKAAPYYDTFQDASLVTEP